MSPAFADQLVLQRIVYLNDPPGISTLAWTPQGLYALADNAPVLYRLNLKSLTRENTLSLAADGSLEVLPKPQKPDFEASSLQVVDGQTWLLVYGSGSLSPMRDQHLRIELATGRIERQPLTDFYRKLTQAIGTDINIEGAAHVADRLLLANRGHQGQPLNHLVRVDQDQGLKVQTLVLPAEPFVGISGLDYDPVSDRLWLTASTEATHSSYHDGAIGDSYLGWIDGFSARLAEHTISPDQLLKLTDLDSRFGGHKIEAVALGGDRIWLASDNDAESCAIFELRQMLVN